ncbi:hypothetical protein A3Q56_04666 [Intoshia linei]|uniref:Uncharacterized protein n=1 Tax=Intoshia linei TaxID=1819745 RepID=A0A177B1K3_9BILA|nr:hypothetical protein A3Q56_04666 [Intoshia linei]
MSLRSTITSKNGVSPSEIVIGTNMTKTGGLCLEFLSDEQFLVGSYDNDILIYDMRNLSNPFNVLKISTPTWRMRYNKEFSRLYLACLNAGPTIITLDDNFNITTSLNLSENFSHSSLVYGFDFDNTKTSSHSDDIVSCSFYDNTVCFANILYGV